MFFIGGSSETTPLVLETEEGLVLVNLTAFREWWQYRLNAVQKVELHVTVTEERVAFIWNEGGDTHFEYSWKQETLKSKLGWVPIQGHFRPERIRFPLHDTSKEVVISSDIRTPCDIRRLPEVLRSVALQKLTHIRRGTNRSLIDEAIRTGLVPLINGEHLCRSLQRVEKIGGRSW